jgi:pyruvate dehydrogenase E1 component alpha subunit
MSDGTNAISAAPDPMALQVGGSNPSAGPEGLTDPQLLEIFRLMHTIRRFEVVMERTHLAGDLYGPFHSSMGQEAVSVGVCTALCPDDVVTSTHRGHGHAIAKGAELGPVCAELWGRSTGYCGGKGGSMHIVSMEHGFVGQSPIIGGSELLATGAALAFDLSGDSRVAVSFMGDGAVGQGVFHETLNLAAIWRLPAVFVVENNGFAHSFRAEQMQLNSDIASRAEGYGIPGMVVDGIDVFSVYKATKAAVERARTGGGPTLIEAKCYRWRGHNLGDAEHLYRPREEVEKARRDDPLDRFRAATQGRIPPERLEEIEAAVEREINKAVRFADQSSPPDPQTALEGSF